MPSGRQIVGQKPSLHQSDDSILRNNAVGEFKGSGEKLETADVGQAGHVMSVSLEILTQLGGRELVDDPGRYHQWYAWYA